MKGFGRLIWNVKFVLIRHKLREVSKREHVNRSRCSLVNFKLRRPRWVAKLVRKTFRFRRGAEAKLTEDC
ncbi:MAG: hypothetical protein ACTS68_00780 [Candidatus Hodgkinia cicadicola]